MPKIFVCCKKRILASMIGLLKSKALILTVPMIITANVFAISQEYYQTGTLTFGKKIMEVAFSKVSQNDQEVYFPKIVVLEDEVRGLTLEGKMIWNHSENASTLRFFFPSVSSDGKYVLLTALHEVKPGPKNLKKKFIDMVQESKLVNANGEIVWRSRIDTVGFESGNGVLPTISNSGNFAFINPANALLTIYDDNGNLVKEIKVVEGWNWKRTVGAVFSDNGDRIVCFVDEPLRTDRDTSSIIAVYEKTGIEVWRSRSQNVHAVNISPDGHFVLVAWSRYHLVQTSLSRSFVTLFDSKGSLVQTFDCSRVITPGYNFHFVFSEDGSYFVLGVNDLVKYFRRPKERVFLKLPFKNHCPPFVQTITAKTALYVYQENLSEYRPPRI
jgi:hypothetical protein